MNTIYTAFTRSAKKATDWQKQVLATLSLSFGVIPEIGPLRCPEAVIRAHTTNSINTRLPEKTGGRFVPAGLLNLSETVGANPQNRALTSRFSYGTGYLKRPESLEVDPVSLSLADREALQGQELFPVNGLGEFGGIRDAAPDAWGRRVIEARRKVPANTLSEAEYLLAAGGDRVGALDVRPDIRSPDSPSASDLHSLEYVMQAAEAVEQGLRAPVYRFSTRALSLNVGRCRLSGCTWIAAIIRP